MLSEENQATGLSHARKQTDTQTNTQVNILITILHNHTGAK